MVYNKEEIVTKMSELGGTTKIEAKRNLEAFLGTLEFCVLNEVDIVVKGYLNMKIKTKPEREGMNPRLGQKVILPAKKIARMQIGGVLKNALNQKG